MFRRTASCSPGPRARSAPLAGGEFVQRLLAASPSSAPLGAGPRPNARARCHRGRRFALARHQRQRRVRARGSARDLADASSKMSRFRLTRMKKRAKIPAAFFRGRARRCARPARRDRRRRTLRGFLSRRRAGGRAAHARARRSARAAAVVHVRVRQAELQRAHVARHGGQRRRPSRVRLEHAREQRRGWWQSLGKAEELLLMSGMAAREPWKTVATSRRAVAAERSFWPPPPTCTPTAPTPRTSSPCRPSAAAAASARTPLRPSVVAVQRPSAAESTCVQDAQAAPSPPCTPPSALPRSLTRAADAGTDASPRRLYGARTSGDAARAHSAGVSSLGGRSTPAPPRSVERQRTLALVVLVRAAAPRCTASNASNARPKKFTAPCDRAGGARRALDALNERRHARAAIARVERCRFMSTTRRALQLCALTAANARAALAARRRATPSAARRASPRSGGSPPE